MCLLNMKKCLPWHWMMLLHPSHTPAMKSKLHLASGWGWSSTTKDFLRPGSVTISITRGISDRKRKCCGILLKKISEDQRKMIKKGWSFLENQATVINITTCV